MRTAKTLIRLGAVILLVLSWGSSHNILIPVQLKKHGRFCLLLWDYLSLVTRKPVFGVCDQVRLEPACSATETTQRLEISDIEIKDIILSRQRTNKGADQTARMRRLICAFVVRIWHKQVFSWHDSFMESASYEHDRSRQVITRNKYPQDVDCLLKYLSKNVVAAGIQNRLWETQASC